MPRAGRSSGKPAVMASTVNLNQTAHNRQGFVAPGTPNPSTLLWKTAPHLHLVSLPSRLATFCTPVLSLRSQLCSRVPMHLLFSLVARPNAQAPQATPGRLLPPTPNPSALLEHLYPYHRSSDPGHLKHTHQAAAIRAMLLDKNCLTTPACF